MVQSAGNIHCYAAGVVLVALHCDEKLSRADHSMTTGATLYRG